MAGLRAPEGSPPLLSVIVPAHDVEAYIDATLSSIVHQTYAHLEVIVVDDGSTDGTALICDRHATADHRVRVIHQANGGLSRARNVGMAEATGEYIAFADSDDVVPITAYEHLVSTLMRSGSDFASGNVRRFDESHSWNAWNQSHSHVHAAVGTTLSQRPELIFDLVCWNKVFRRSFIDRIDLSFPVDRLYEDMEPMAQAYTRAASVDVLTQTVYHYRRRDTGNSIAQQRHELDNLRQKIAQMDRVFTIVAGGESTETLDHLHVKALSGDLFAYADELGEASPVFRQTFSAAALRYWGTTSPAARLRLPDLHRVFYAVLDRYGIDAAVSTNEHLEQQLHDLPTRVRRHGVQIDARRAKLPIPALPRVARTLLSETQVVSHVEGMWWQGPRLVLRGWAYLPHVDDATEQTVTLQARHQVTGRTIDLRVRATTSRGAARHARSTRRDHSGSGFTAELDTEEMQSGESSDIGRWELQVTVSVGRFSRSGAMTSFDRTGSLRAIGPRAHGVGTEIVARVAARQPLGLDVRRPEVMARSVQVSERQVRVLVTHPPHVTIAATSLDHAHPLESIAGSVQQHDTSTSLQFEVPAARSRPNITRRIKIVLADGRIRNVSPHEVTTTPIAGSSLSVGISRTGWLDINDFAKTALVEDVEPLDDFRFRLSGQVPADVALEVSVHRTHAEPGSWQPARVADGRFLVDVDLGHRDWYGTRRPRSPGTYAISVRTTIGDFSDHSWQARCAVSLLTTIPRDIDGPMACVSIRADVDGMLQLQVSLPHEQAEPGAFALRERREQFGPDADISPERAVFFACDIGSSAHGHPLAIFEELSGRDAGFGFYWGVSDFSVPIPPGATAVVRYSSAWFMALASCTHVVIDYGGLDGLVRRPHQKVLQTWHGTPYKFIGRSQITQQRMVADEARRQHAEGAGWDLMISTSPYYSERVPHDLDYQGPLAEVGSPRNDALVNATVDRRVELRTALGIPLGRKVLLYTPTFRDQLRSSWVAAPFRGLNLERLAQVLGTEWVVVARGHSFNARHGGRYTSSSAQVIDATDHPDINHLYLISDALLTDYSSTMFDYCVTGRPIVFFVPDHESYLVHRGAYFDLAAIAPGPLCTSEEDLFIELGRLDTYAETFGERYDRFRERFVPWDDGRASERVVDQFFDLRKVHGPAASP